MCLLLGVESREASRKGPIPCDERRFWPLSWASSTGQTVTPDAGQGLKRWVKMRRIEWVGCHLAERASWTQKGLTTLHNFLVHL